MNYTSPIIRTASLAAVLVGLTTILVISGCAGPQVSTPPPTVQISAKMPVIVALPETKEAQEKGGVEIAVVPIAYQAVKKETTSIRPVAPGFGEMLGASIATGGNSRNLILVERTTESNLVIDPARLAFTVRINNKLNRVFRGQGAVVQINVDGTMQSFDHVDYHEFINGIVPPRNETALKITADALGHLRDNGTIGIYLYDVVTATDVAGNTTEKQNYEWFFTYTTKTVEERAEKRVERQYLDAAAYQQELMKQQQQQMQQQMMSMRAGLAP